MEEEKEKRPGGFRFDRMEFAGSLGDLGTLVPLAAGMIILNGLSPSTVLLWVGLFYVLSGVYYRLPIPVQPLKVVAAIAIASPESVNVNTIAAAGISFGVILLVLSLTGAMRAIASVFTKPVVRGIQLGLGLLLLRKGLALITANEIFVSAEKAAVTHAGYINIALGVAVFIAVLLLINNRKVPAAIFALAVGIVVGVAFGGLGMIDFAVGPSKMSLVLPALDDFLVAIPLLVIPQIPLTLGNACVGTADTCCTLFPEQGCGEKTSPGKFAFTMGIINIPAGLMAAMPMCHGAGGLAAHYRFGARTGGSNLIIAAVFIVLALVFGKVSLELLTLIPSAVLGVLLAFAGIELSLLARDIEDKKSMFVVALVAGIGLSGTGMAWAFLAGIAADFVIRRLKIEV